MLQKIFSVAVVVVLIETACLSHLNAQSPTQQKSQSVQFKENIARWGVGKKVTVKMIDGNSFMGPISQIADEGFVVSDQARGRDVPVDYNGVKSVKAQHSRLFKTLVGVGAVIVILGIVMGAACASGGCGDSQ